MSSTQRGGNTSVNQTLSTRQQMDEQYRSSLKERFKEYSVKQAQQQSISAPRQQKWRQQHSKLLQQSNSKNAIETNNQNIQDQEVQTKKDLSLNRSQKKLHKSPRKQKQAQSMNTTHQGSISNSTLKARNPYTKEELQAEYERMTNNLEQSLMQDKNYKVFYWAPDYSFCGFATQEQVKQTAQKWFKDKRLKINERQIVQEKSKEDLTSNVSHIPEIMQYLKNTKMEL